MNRKRKWLGIFLSLALLAGVVGAFMAYRVHRTYSVVSDFGSRVRYLIETGGTIGEAPASRTFSGVYLRAIFGDDPSLLEEISAVVQRGLADDPTLSLGEVAALIVTYRRADDGSAYDVVVHAVGGFPLSRNKHGFHRNGYFFQLLDKNLWNYGNLLVGFIGRDMILFGEEDDAVKKQNELIDSMLTGDISVMVNHIATPVYYTAVFPEPRHIIPQQLQKHIQAVILKGKLGHYDGNWEIVGLTPRPASASYALSIMKDIKMAAEVALKTRWKGADRDTPWGKQQGLWWAREMCKTLEKAVASQDHNIITFKTDFERVMVNAILKSMERLSRDLAAMRGIMGERLDPRLVDASLKTRKPLHYWSDPHRWGPDWPIPPSGRTNSMHETSTPEEAPPKSEPVDETATSS